MLSINLSFFLVCLSTYLVFGQSTISGRVFDSETQESLPYANVFLSKTTIGSSSDLDGYFRIEDVPNGNYELVVQYIGYDLFVTQITILEKKSLQLTVGLIPKPFEGKEMIIEAKMDKFWKDCFEKTVSKFSELEPENDDEYQNWLINREKIYKGSFKHFFSSLATNHKDIFDYKIFLIREEILRQEGLYYQVSLDDLYKCISDSIGFKKLFLEYFLRITYDNGSKEIEAGMVIQGKEKYFLFDNFGTIMSPIHIARYWYWGYLRFADRLPDDYRPTINKN